MYKCRKPRPESYLQPDCLALRTIRSHYHVTPDNRTQSFRITSAAYSWTDDGSVSVDLGQLITEDGLPLTALYPSMTQAVALVSHRIDALHVRGLSVQHEPVAEDWYHGGIYGVTDALRRKLAKSASTVVPIDQAAARAFWEMKNGKLPW